MVSSRSVHHALDALREGRCAEVEQEAHGQVEQSQVGQQLTCKHRFKSGDGFQLDDDLILHEQVHPECVSEYGAVIRERDALLS